jgi:hypothetical protein
MRSDLLAYSRHTSITFPDRSLQTNLTLPLFIEMLRYLFLIGLATAAGCQLVATCDIAVASDKAQFATPG